MRGKIVIVSLDLYLKYQEFDEFQEFDSLPAHKKLSILSMHIDAICKILTQQAPDAMWILGWREGVVNSEEEEIVPAEIKKLYKEVMMGLVHHYPNLTLIAGALTSRKTSTSSKKLDEIECFYDLHKWISEEELKDGAGVGMEDSELLRHKKQIEEVRLARKEQGEDLEFNIVRNTTYVFSGNNVFRHDKHTPINETLGLTKHMIFQPAKGRNLSPIVKLKHPMTDEEFTVGIEICREHNFDILKKEVGTVSSAEVPLFHFVISNHIALKLKSVAAPNVVHLDTFSQSKWIVTNLQQLQNLDILFYRDNLLEVPQLEGPIPPLYPFEKKVLDLLDKIISQLPVDSERRKLFENFRLEFLSISESPISTDVYKFLIKNIPNLKNDYVFPKLGLFMRGPDIEKPLKELKDLIVSTQKEHPQYMDISERPRR